jgi:hypothetical protein
LAGQCGTSASISAYRRVHRLTCGLERVCCSWVTSPDNTQIYEGINQIQRVVMARQLLK